MILKDTGRIATLDALRGIAALSVVAYHLTFRVNTLYPEVELPAFNWPYGSVGVQLFFLISGFVIFRTLDRVKKSKDFIVSRFARLYPAYWAAAALTFIVVAVFGLPGRETTWWQALYNLTMTQYWVGVPAIDGSYWSLGVELFFYAAILVAWRLGWLKGRRVEVFILAWVGAALAWALLVHSGPAYLLGTRVALPWIHLFAAGMCVYKIKTLGPTIPTVAIVAATPFIEFAQKQEVITALLVAGCLTIFLLATLTNAINFLACKPLLFLGAISYPLYLVHQNIGYILELRLVSLPTEVTALAAIALAVLLATAITFWVERPARVWILAKLGNKQQATAVVSAANEGASVKA